MNFSNSYGLSVARTSFGLGLVAVIISIILTILLVVLVVPAKRREGLPKFFQVVHDICNFKGLLLEKVLKVLYIFSTINVMLTGIFTWFSGRYDFGMTFLAGLLIHEDVSSGIFSSRSAINCRSSFWSRVLTRI